MISKDVIGGILGLVLSDMITPPVPQPPNEVRFVGVDSSTLSLDKDIKVAKQKPLRQRLQEADNELIWARQECDAIASQLCTSIHQFEEDMYGAGFDDYVIRSLERMNELHYQWRLLYREYRLHN